METLLHFHHVWLRMGGCGCCNNHTIDIQIHTLMAAFHQSGWHSPPKHGSDRFPLVRLCKPSYKRQSHDTSTSKPVQTDVMTVVFQVLVLSFFQLPHQSLYLCIVWIVACFALDAKREMPHTMSGQLCLATCSICPILDFNISASVRGLSRCGALLGSTGCRIFMYVCCCTCISLWRQWTSTWWRWSCCVLLVQLKKQFSVWACEQKAEPPHTHYRLFVQSVISLQSSLHCSPFMRRACISISSHSLQPMLVW